MDKKVTVEVKVLDGEKQTLLFTSPQLKEELALQIVQSAQKQVIEASLNGEKALIVPDSASGTESTWGIAKIVDMAELAAKNAPEPSLLFRDLVSQKDFLTALADSQVGPKNIASIWENNIRKLLGLDYSKKDPALDLAENQSSTGLAITTVRVLEDNKKSDVPVHIILNKDINKALIIGGSIAPSLSAAFNKASITYVDRTAGIAVAQIEEALDKLTNNLKTNPVLLSKTEESRKQEAKMYLRDAFGYRNVIDEKNEQWPLSALLVDLSVEQNFRKFVIKNKPGM